MKTRLLMLLLSAATVSPVALPSAAHSVNHANPAPITIESLLNAAADASRSVSDAVPQEEPAVSAYVLVSFSMPHASLMRLARDAKDAGIPLAFAGVPLEANSVEKATKASESGAPQNRPILNPQRLAVFKPLIDIGASVELHPELFTDYGIRQVPLLLLKEESVSAAGCAQTPRAVGVPGDVTLGFALDRLTDRTDAIGAKAREYRRKLGGRS